MQFIVKLFPEITVKSAPVRKRMTRQLRENLRTLLRGVDRGFRISRDWEKIDIYHDANDDGLRQRAIQVLSHTPGIANFAEVRAFPFVDLDHVTAETVAVWGDALAGKTFCVRIKRNGDHDFTSTEAERHIGGGLLHQTEAAGVKLKAPEVTVRLEIRGDTAFILLDKQPGLGGFPIGTQDPVLSLVSGGFDSTVASYLTMRRGLRTHFLFFNLGGREHEVGVKEIAYYLWQKYGASHHVRFITIPFEEVVTEILTKIDDRYMGVVLKRMFLRVAEKVADHFGVRALVTGEAVAQVSSQTLPNLAVIDRVTEKLVLRPLATFDKGEIINLARQTGTEDFAANIPEYCGVISKHPTTRAKLDRLEATEQHFDFEVLERAFDNRMVQQITELRVGETLQPLEIFEDIPEGATVLDVRHPEEQEQHPLALEGAAVVAIPFFQLHQRFSELDKNSHYLLYCQKGVMSRLQAEHLRDQGFIRVGIYRR